MIFLLKKHDFEEKKNDFDAICIIYVIFSKVAYGNHVMAYNTFKQIADLELI